MSDKVGIWDKFKAPTPLRMRMFGYALLSACTAASTFTAASSPYVAIGLLVIGFIGKFITDFWAEPKQ